MPTLNVTTPEEFRANIRQRLTKQCQKKRNIWFIVFKLGDQIRFYTPTLAHRLVQHEDEMQNFLELPRQKAYIRLRDGELVIEDEDQDQVELDLEELLQNHEFLMTLHYTLMVSENPLRVKVSTLVAKLTGQGYRG